MNKYLLLIYMFCIFATSCQFYENIPDDKVYKGKIFVQLNGYQSAVSLTRQVENNPPKMFVDKLIISKPYHQDVIVNLGIVDEKSYGEVGEHFSFQKTVKILAGENYGNFEISALNIDVLNVDKYMLAIKILDVNSAEIIPGLYGSKMELGEREKNYKVYVFKN